MLHIISAKGLDYPVILIATDDVLDERRVTDVIDASGTVETSPPEFV